MNVKEVRRLAAFTTDPNGGNKAGVWIGAQLPNADAMQAIAAEVGYSETVFACPTVGAERTVRYFSPIKEVPFCGHATIALGVALGTDNGHGSYNFKTASGPVAMTVEVTDSLVVASLTSVSPTNRPAPSELVQQALKLLDWADTDLDVTIPPAVAFAGAHHLVIAVTDRKTLSRLEYDFVGLKKLMETHDLTTLQLVCRRDDTTFDARNPFPVGGVVEDPATGAAAAAFGGYLRSLRLVDPPAELVIHQGADIGLPSRIDVTIPASGGIVVKGTAVSL